MDYSDWDVALRFHEFREKRVLEQQKISELKKISIQAVVQRARDILGSITRPEDVDVVPWDPTSMEKKFEMDFDETFENEMVSESPTPWVIIKRPRKKSLVLVIDTSLSMTGEKLALTAVAIAVVLLQFPEDSLGIVCFENEAQVLKSPDESLSIEMVLERFLDLPLKGYTHLEQGLKEALAVGDQIPSLGRRGRLNTVLISDGKYTAGKDPTYLAHRFEHLTVLKMGEDHSSRELCEDLARCGEGHLWEVAALEELPSAIYGVTKDLLR